MGKDHKFYLLFVLMMFLLLSYTSMAVIADDDEEGDDDDRQEYVQQPTVSQPKTQTMEVYIPAKTYIVSEKQLVSLPDTDRDGIIDEEDAHPDIAEIYIVLDGNGNGIVDSYEIVTQ